MLSLISGEATAVRSQPGMLRVKPRCLRRSYPQEDSLSTQKNVPCPQFKPRSTEALSMGQISRPPDALTDFLLRAPFDGEHAVPGARLGTWKGRRAENQDRAIVAFISDEQTGKSLFLAAVLDGMGGMADGALAASLAASTFVSAVARPSDRDLKSRLDLAIAEANERVAARTRGQGGSTLTTVVIAHGGQGHAAHVGDSRLYASRPEVLQITTDDTLCGLLGLEGHGGLESGLMQFVGIGDRMVAQTYDIGDHHGLLLLTSDGFHSTADVSIALAEHCLDGALASQGVSGLLEDNATCISIDQKQVDIQIEAHQGTGAIYTTHGRYRLQE